jgi:nicotinamidase/pyrazinamidase
MISIAKSVTASFEVDPQRGFTPLCPDELPVAEGHCIADELNAQARLAGFRLVSKDCHPAKAPWVANRPDEIMTPVAGDYPGLDIKWPAHCVVGTAGNLLIPGLPAESAYDLVVEKGTDPLNHPYGACYHDLGEQRSTGVIEWLRQRRVETVLVGGLATDYCVKTTVLQLRRAGFRVIVNLAACRGVAGETTAAAIAAMGAAGAETVASCADLLAV